MFKSNFVANPLFEYEMPTFPYVLSRIGDWNLRWSTSWRIQREKVFWLFDRQSCGKGESCRGRIGTDSISDMKEGP